MRQVRWCVPAGQETIGVWGLGRLPVWLYASRVSSVEEAYASALASHAAVAAARREYEDAVARRAAAFRDLRDHGESLGKIARAMGLSPTRVAQIIGQAAGPPSP